MERLQHFHLKHPEPLLPNAWLQSKLVINGPGHGHQLLAYGDKRVLGKFDGYARKILPLGDFADSLDNFLGQKIADVVVVDASKKDMLKALAKWLELVKKPAKLRGLPARGSGKGPPEKRTMLIAPQ